jgi:hypothetical protein
MKYTEAAEDFGDRGNAENKLRLTGERKNSMIKAFHQDNETWLGSIVKLVWATNPKMKHLHNIVEDCRFELDVNVKLRGWSKMRSNLEKNGGRCDCRKHTFLRGNEMSQEA